MEPIGWIILFWLGAEVISGDEIAVDDREKVEIVVEERKEFLFKQGKYYQSQFGYYISNLNDKPCEINSILIADLSEQNHESLTVNEVELRCAND